MSYELLPIDLLVHPITFVPKRLMESKVCPMDYFNIAFSPACPYHPIVPKGLMYSKQCPMDSFNTTFSYFSP